MATEVVQLRPSSSKPDRGIIGIRQATLNQRDEEVLRQETTIFLKRRTPVTFEA